MHIEHGIEERARRRPLIEEPEDRSRTRGGRISSRPPTPLPTTLTLARKVWSSSFVPAWVEELVTTGE
ncbi:hypothetical protein U9M48_028833 [Paspalum notatum var. saurae]|uniref:Uncharacterized protein n=1 Tax=Paspalum notatum var. saurae TaxID=547442 RepID=A0AAQ3TXL9_PASNO